MINYILPRRCFLGANISNVLVRNPFIGAILMSKQLSASKATQSVKAFCQDYMFYSCKWFWRQTVTDLIRPQRCTNWSGYLLSVYAQKAHFHIWITRMGSCIFKEYKNNKLNQRMTKPTKWHVRPAKTQISLGIHPVWSVFAVLMLKSLDTHWAHSKDSDQSGQMPRLIWVLAGCTCHFL